MPVAQRLRPFGTTIFAEMSALADQTGSINSLGGSAGPCRAMISTMAMAAALVSTTLRTT